MNIKIKYISTFLGKVSLALFIILTLFILLNRIPWSDEANSYILSRFSLSELFEITRMEGHTLLWYLIIKPFNNINWYPYPMLIINWLFMVFAMAIFWKKAPFNKECEGKSDCAIINTKCDPISVLGHESGS